MAKAKRKSTKRRKTPAKRKTRIVRKTVYKYRNRPYITEQQYALVKSQVLRQLNAMKNPTFANSIAASVISSPPSSASVKRKAAFMTRTPGGGDA